jgi:hypothetical protein
MARSYAAVQEQQPPGCARDGAAQGWGAVAEGDELRAGELRARLELVLRRLALTSTVAARGLIGGASHGKPGSSPPTGGPSAAEHYAREAERAGDDAQALAILLRRADAELTHLLRRDLAPMPAPTLADLRATIVDRGEGFTVDEVSIAMRCSATMVRKARLLAGRDAERGRPLPLREVNGKPTAFGLELISAGFSFRAASQLSGVARSTLHAHVARATNDVYPKRR